MVCRNTQSNINYPNENLLKDEHNINKKIDLNNTSVNFTKMEDNSKQNENGLDQFYTNKNMTLKCYNKVQ